ncbi:MFS transporter [Legionella maceachernii]|uniref:Multidrug resistance protein, MFS superfamily n=1 Tax=Legionella maceachernii TaxID=466 RepID=A0A0W0WHX8_9GAMM|nr:MFS transporter [Legionella maceachernii]KTD31972.1 multidrug resistance protein, MFS superfamily [Legionella maceachernii]SKA24158.1 MFS transporter, DHA2 family, multidrug resistance protein [Legionella maceachernii]SUP04250.1 Multidrug resistance protein B [Legionella maceachernii]
MILYVLILALAAVVFNLTLPIMAGLYIVSDLGGSSYLTSYAVSFFCIGNILGVPLGKPSSTGLRAIPLFLLCLTLMCIFSWCCAMSTNYFEFILFRFLEGVASGPLFILIPYTLIPRLASEKDKSLILSLLLISFTLAPVLAASYGGWIAYYHNWRILFLSNIPLCLFLIISVSYAYRKHHRPADKVHFDAMGYFFYSISIIFIGTALTISQELDWFRSSLITFLLIAGSISLVFFILHSLSSPFPILDLRLLKHLYFSLAMLNVSLLFAIYFGMVILLGLWLKLYVNYTPNWIALIIGTMALGAWIPIAFSRLRYDPRLPLTVSLVFFAISSFYTTYFNVDINFDRIAFSRILAGVGLALFLAPLFRLSTQTPPPEKLPEALCFFHVSRLLGSGLGVSLFLILWHRRQVFYHERLGSNLTAFSQLTNQFFERAKFFNIQGKQALAQLDVYLERQATALALDDCFFLMGWILVALLILLSLTFFFPDPVLHDTKEPSEEKQETNLPPKMA